ncbi:unnamed protein product [Parascedosporium putredinis]|uniref:Uncharacterized protein n=1 Tax=Parascedosporium putredinis TaxID=1442378 RepID=A0A9P1GWN8_9PEZI|nr:unnamed protein product [Parascedosporium putredinis]CAI7988446.1 unnamed protein product [Parascedosporium putredinis]
MDLEPSHESRAFERLISTQKGANDLQTRAGFEHANITLSHEYARQNSLAIAFNEVVDQRLMDVMRKLSQDCGSTILDETCLRKLSPSPANLEDTILEPDRRLSLSEEESSLNVYWTDGPFVNQRKQEIPSPSLELPIQADDTFLTISSEATRISQKREVCWRRMILPLAPLDEARDEGISFPACAEQLRSRLDKDLSSEMIDHLYGAEALHIDDACGDESKARLREARAISRLLHLEDWVPQLSKKPSLTPPLLAPSPDVRLFVPDNDSCKIECCSDPLSLIDEDLEAAEQCLLGAEEQRDMSLDDRDVRHLLEWPQDDLVLEAVAGEISNLKVEVPLTIDKRVSFREPSSLPTTFALERAPDLKQAVRTKSVAATLNTEHITTCDDKLIQDLCETGIFASRRVEQENLDEGRGRRRVPIPVLDFSISPYQHKGLTEVMEGLSQHENRSLALTSWAFLIGHNRERILLWNPFANDVSQPSFQDDISMGQESANAAIIYKDFDLLSHTIDAYKTSHITNASWDDIGEIGCLVQSAQQCPSLRPNLNTALGSKRGLTGDIISEIAFKRLKKDVIAESRARIEGGKVQGIFLDDEPAIGGLLASYLRCNAPNKVFKGGTATGPGTLGSRHA